MKPELLVAALHSDDSPMPLARAAAWAEPLQFALDAAEVNAPHRLAAFLAQIGHESDNFTVLEESLNYSAEALLRVFPKYFSPAQAASYARQPERIGSKVYGGRMGNGPETSGDGWRYRGRGLIQLTGLINYKEFGRIAGLDTVGNPDLLLDKRNACLSAAWFWKSRGLNRIADAKDLRALTMAINGGLNGFDDRQRRYLRAQAALKPRA